MRRREDRRGTLRDLIRGRLLETRTSGGSAGLLRDREICLGGGIGGIGDGMIMERNGEGTAEIAEEVTGVTGTETGTEIRTDIGRAGTEDIRLRCRRPGAEIGAGKGRGVIAGTESGGSGAPRLIAIADLTARISGVEFPNGMHGITDALEQLRDTPIDIRTSCTRTYVVLLVTWYQPRSGVGAESWSRSPKALIQHLPVLAEAPRFHNCVSRRQNLAFLQTN